MPCACSSRASERRLPTTAFHRQSTTPTMSGYTFSVAEPESPPSPAASSPPALTRSAAARVRQYSSISSTSATMPSARRKLSWFVAF